MSTSDLHNWGVKTGCAQLRSKNRICTIEVSKLDVHKWGVKTESVQLRCQNRICAIEVSKPGVHNWGIKTRSVQVRCQNRICIIEVSKPALRNWGVKTSSAQWWISQSAQLSRSHLSIPTTTTTLKSVTFVRCLRTHFGVLEHPIAFPCLFPKLF